MEIPHTGSPGKLLDAKITKPGNDGAKKLLELQKISSDRSSVWYQAHNLQTKPKVAQEKVNRSEDVRW